MCPTILIVEDHNALRASLCDWLTLSFPDYALIEAKSGEEAIALARDQKPDIVLMDIGLPQMNGIEATRHIKAAVPQSQVIILTIHEAPQYRDDALSAGASAYIIKPRAHRELIPTVRRLLSQTE